MEKPLIELFDRFSFDDYFRSLLKEGFDHEEAKEHIVYSCCLSALVLQERIYNNYYEKISIGEDMSDDLKEYRQDIFNKKYPNKN